MAQVKSNHWEELADAARARNGRTRSRMAIGGLIGLIYLPILPWRFCLTWFFVYGLSVAFEWWLLASVGRPSSRSTWKGVGPLGLIAVYSLILSAPGLVAFHLVSPLGPAIGTAHLLGAAFICASASRRSLLAFVAGTVPPVIALVVSITVVSSEIGSAPGAQIAALFGLVGLVGVATVLHWRATTHLFRSEQLAREMAQSASAAKSTFVATVSHELRTPISAIQAGGAELERRATDEGQRQAAALILDAARMMRTLLDDLLDHAKVEAGRMTVESIAFAPRDVLVRSIRFWQAEARKKGLRLRVEGARYLPRSLVGDPTRLRQVLNNLLSNALKFTEAGAVTLEIAFEGDCIAFCVADQGIGMTEKQMARLFTPFGQADESVARTHGGTGLGLVLSRDLVRLMGGELTVESILGQGSRFAFRLRLSGTAEVAAVGTIANNQLEPISELRILAVDDHEINRRAMKIVLDAFGLQASFAVDGAEALGRLLQEPFDVVLMDIHMPGMDGLEVCRRVRMAPGPNRSTPIIAVTGAAETENRARYLDAGVTSCIGKPIQSAELYEALSETLSYPVAA